jgi:ketopantoate reductase
MNSLQISCYEPVQAHKLLNTELWPMLKSMLMAGHKMVIELRPEKRSDPQNRKMWAMLTEVSEQVEWHGQRLSSEDWKHIFSASLKKQRAVPGLDGGFVVLGQKTSRMTKQELSELIELIHAFGAERNVTFNDLV